MAMHKASGKTGLSRTVNFDDLAYNYNVAVFNILEEGDREKFNKLINSKETWVRADDITIHPMERAGKVYVVVFHHSSSNVNIKPPQDKLTPKELLEGDSDDRDDAVNVDEEPD